jgi:hypothetical protein
VVYIRSNVDNLISGSVLWLICRCRARSAGQAEAPPAAGQPGGANAHPRRLLHRPAAEAAAAAGRGATGGPGAIRGGARGLWGGAVPAGGLENGKMLLCTRHCDQIVLMYAQVHNKEKQCTASSSWDCPGLMLLAVHCFAELSTCDSAQGCCCGLVMRSSH